MSRNFTNRNVCKNFKKTVNTSAFVELNGNTGTSKGAGGTGEECSQVLLSHSLAGGILVLDRWDAAGTDNVIFVPEDVPTTLRGITNVDDLSAKAVSTGGSIYYRTEFYDGIILTG